MSHLSPQEIQAYIDKPRKKKGSQLEGYKIAQDPTKWREERDALAAREKERQEQKPKRKRVSERLPKQAVIQGQGNPGKDEKADEGKSAEEKSTADEERPLKRAKKQSMAFEDANTGDHADKDVIPAAAVSDPEATKVTEWKHRLYRAFLTTATPAPNKDMAELDAIFTAVEQYEKMTAEYLIYSKIGDDMRKILYLPTIPSDEQYHFRQRAHALVTKWHQLTTVSGSRHQA